MRAKEPPTGSGNRAWLEARRPLSGASVSARAQASAAVTRRVERRIRACARSLPSWKRADAERKRGYLGPQRPRHPWPRRVQEAAHQRPARHRGSSWRTTYVDARKDSMRVSLLSMDARSLATFSEHSVSIAICSSNFRTIFLASSSSCGVIVTFLAVFAVRMSGISA